MHAIFDQILIRNELQISFNQFDLKLIKLIKLKVNIISFTIKLIIKYFFKNKYNKFSPPFH